MRNMRLIVLLVGIAGSSAAVEPPTCDPAVTSFHANPLNCTQYYTCFNGVATLQTCPDQKYYDPTRNLCDLPIYVSCTVGPCTGKTGLAAVAITGVCNAYTLCLDGTAFNMTCSTGTLFDEVYGDCVKAMDSTCAENPCLTVDPATASPSTFYPSAKLCKNYIVCDKLNPVVRTCLGVNVFNPTEAKCVPPTAYTCPPGTI